MGLYQFTIILGVSIGYLLVFTFEDMMWPRRLPIGKVTIVKRRRRPIVRTRHALTIQLRVTSNMTNVKGVSFAFRFATCFRHLTFCCAYKGERILRLRQVELLCFRFVEANKRRRGHRARRRSYRRSNRSSFFVRYVRVLSSFGALCFVQRLRRLVLRMFVRILMTFVREKAVRRFVHVTFTRYLRHTPSNFVPVRVAISPLMPIGGERQTFRR